IDSDALQWPNDLPQRPLRTKIDPGRALLLLVKRPDLIGSEDQGRSKRGIDTVEGHPPCRSRHIDGVELDAIDLAGVVKQGFIPAGAHVVDDTIDHLLGGQRRTENALDSASGALRKL